MWDVIRGLVREGTTLLLTTQYLEEADELADTIAVVDHGKIIARGTADELKAQVGGERIEVVVHDRAAVPRAMEVLSRGLRRRRHARRAHPPADGPGQRRRRRRLVQVVRDLDEAGHRASTTSASAGRRSTTCSWPSPATRPSSRRRRDEPARPQPRRRSHDDGHDRLARGPAAAPARRSPTAWSSPGATSSASRASRAGDLRDPPVDHVRAAVRVRVRRRDPAARDGRAPTASS